MAAEPIQTGFLDNLAVKGYDVVAYFDAGRAVEGSKAHSHRWMDAEWRFSSAENLRLFVADAQKYAPQYGGYCAWAVAQGKTAKIDPEAWRVVDGKLYLNYSKKIQARWEKNIEGNIRAADTHWPELVDP